MKKADFLRRYNNPEDDKKDIEGLVQAYELAVDYGMETDSLFDLKFDLKKKTEKTTKSRL